MLRVTPRSVLALCAMTFFGCGSNARVEMAAPDPCALGAGVPRSDTVTVGLSSLISARGAPVPSSDDERLVFGSVYATLVTVDCRGAVRPALAESWEYDAATESWTIRLRAGAAFWDGSVVTAERVRESWIVHGSTRAHPWRQSPELSVTARDERTLAVSFRQSGPTALYALADPRLAVRSGTSRDWPIGAGEFAVVASDSLSVTAEPTARMSRDPLPVLRFVSGRRDARDLLDRPVDFLVTRAPDVLDYAQRLPRYEVHPLAWDRVYVLAVPSRLGREAPQADAFGLQLAREVIRADARPAGDRYWWSDSNRCAPSFPASMRIPPLPRVVYPSGDAAARAIAERTVALLRAGELSAQVPAADSLRLAELAAVGATPAELAEWLEWPRAAAFVLALPAQVLDPCVALGALRESTGWITSVDAPLVLVPLIETRASVVVRRGSAGMSLLWGGTPSLDAARWHGR